MRILVTGSDGFIGKKLTQELKNLGHEVLPFDLSSGNDICSWSSVSTIQHIDMIYHLAAISFVPFSYEQPGKMYNVNVHGTMNILELARQRGAKLVFMSSYVYGQPDYLPIDEKHPLKPFNPYCQSKILGEQLCEAYHRDFNVPIMIFRPFNIYGYGQRPEFLIPLIIEQVSQGEVSLKDPRPKRDYIHVDDVVSAMIKASSLSFGYETLNLGSGISYSVKEVVEILLESSEKNVEVSYLNEFRKNEVLDTIANIEKTSHYLSWKPEIDFRTGIAEFIELMEKL